MIDLQQFCGTEAYHERRELHRPFLSGGFTWAVNGHILVRVAPIDGCKPQKEPLNLDHLANTIGSFSGVMTPISRFVLPDFTPQTSKIKCDECDGRGREHDCPDCQCDCEECNGTGLIDKTAECSVEILGSIFNIEYLRMVAALPGAEIGLTQSKDMMVFRFDGGEGLLMGMRSPHEIHHVISPRAEAAE